MPCSLPPHPSPHTPLDSPQQRKEKKGGQYLAFSFHWVALSILVSTGRKTRNGDYVLSQPTEASVTNNTLLKNLNISKSIIFHYILLHM